MIFVDSSSQLDRHRATPSRVALSAADIFGLPDRGKSHTCCAIGHELIQRGYRVLFQPTFRLVQQLLIAKHDLKLERALRHLDGFDVVVLDYIGYVQQSREEMEVLFTFLAERYERRSVMIPINLVSSACDKIFKDPMTTAAAIDRLVHHATILEMDGPGVRAELAEQRNPNRKALAAENAAHARSRSEERTGSCLGARAVVLWLAGCTRSSSPCRAAGLDPELYLEAVLRAVSTTAATEIASLTPWAWAEAHPEHRLPDAG